MSAGDEGPRSDGEDQYEVLSELGRGGLGVVMLARHRALDRLVAIKRVQQARARDETSRQRLHREARALARLNHPNVVRLYDVIDSDADLLIVMEYVPGTSLDQLRARTSVAPAAAVAILSDVAAALGHAHSEGVVHRDVKPANVLVMASGQAKLTDFGLARLVADQAAFRTRPGTVMGTAAYMAPEQILGDEDVSEAVDAYAFAVMAYELLTGGSPYDVVGTRALIDAHLVGSPRAPRTLVPGFPESAEAALLAGLAKDPAQRATVGEIKDALAEVPAGAWPAPAARTDPGPVQARGPSTVETGAPAVGPQEGYEPVPRVEGTTATVRASSGSPPDPPVMIEPLVYRPPAGRSRSRRRVRAVAIGAAVGIGLGIAIAVLERVLG